MTYPLTLCSGDTFNLDVGGQKYTWTAVNKTVLHSEAEALTLVNAFPRHHQAGDWIGTFNGRRHITGEEIVFFSIRQLKHFLATAEGIPEIGLVTPQR